MIRLRVRPALCRDVFEERIQLLIGGEHAVLRKIAGRRNRTHTLTAHRLIERRRTTLRRLGRVLCAARGLCHLRSVLLLSILVTHLCAGPAWGRPAPEHSRMPQPLAKQAGRDAYRSALLPG